MKTRRMRKDDRRSRERRTRADKRPTRKNDHKALVAEESNKNFADSDSDSTSSSSSSSDSDHEETHCLMANQSIEEEVFDFSNTKFTREDLINALNEMVHEYKKLSQTFKEVKAENMDLKNSSVEPSTVQLENERLNQVMSSWTQSSVSLSKLDETQKPLNDKSGLGFNGGESSSGDTCTQSKLVYDKFKNMNFVKAIPENSKSSWLKNRLDKEKEKAGSKSFVQNQLRRDSKKVKSVWRKVQSQQDLNGQSTKIKLNRSHNVSARTLKDFHTGKTIKVRRLSRPSQGSLVFRRNDSAGHHIKSTLELSGTTNQPADHNV
ncbi:hypothetical protein F511_22359 [Dorcoceras hygrometricum]|uniref:Uncharacterized protein n=1 Tax=Dorcoceras hygrometricum TaxID=472368 RepID=A0A2Z7CH01_9LAMI|nr:hypothetical protein F511_22359 [Dorcoceras hygrometricum]